MSLANAQLKPLDLTGHSHPSRTHLLPSDLSGILTHGRHHRSATSPLIHPDRPNTPHDEQLIDQTRKWVAQTFFGTMLKQMRNSPFKSPMFEGGRGGEAFGEMYDQRLAEHMSRGAGNKLVGAIVRSIVNGEANKKKNAARAVAAYSKHKTLATAGVSAGGNHAGTFSEGGGDARSFAQKRRAAPPNIYSIRK